MNRIITFETVTTFVELERCTFLGKDPPGSAKLRRIDEERKEDTKCNVHNRTNLPLER